MVAHLQLHDAERQAALFQMKECGANRRAED